MPTASRRVALEAMRDIRRGELADRSLAARVEPLEPRDRAWTWELVMGLQRARGRIDWLLARHVKRGLDALQADVLDILRLGAYQLTHMGGVPAYAAISQSVELARAAGVNAAAPLVNGVLRSVQRAHAEEDAPWPHAAADPVGWLTSAGSHPRWLVERWLARWGFEETRALVEANDARPELYIRPIGIGTVEAERRLAETGIVVESVTGAPDALRVVPPAGPEDVLALVPAIVQDPAATLVARYASVPPGARVADLCAAPGGKAFAFAAAAGPVVAMDVSERRIERIAEGRERLGLEALWLVVADAREAPLRPASFEVVFLDVPCTGTGTLRRHPDGKWRLGPADLDSLVALQRDILDAAAEIVAPGGVLVYATCSLEPEENEQQVEAFLARDDRFEPAPGDHGLDPALTDGKGRLAVLPQRHGFDGAFAARLHRKR